MYTYNFSEENNKNRFNDFAHLIYTYIFFISFTVPVTAVLGVLGKKASLPCDINSNDPKDAISMVLWFKATDGEPLYR